jgi:hypothetical protein
MTGEGRIAMISRIRIEAMAPDPETCRRDIFAAIHQTIGHTSGDLDGSPPSVFYSSWVVEEVYERLAWNERTQPEVGERTEFKGRVVLGMPINYGDSLHGSDDGREVYKSVNPNEIEYDGPGPMAAVG